MKKLAAGITAILLLMGNTVSGILGATLALEFLPVPSSEERSAAASAGEQAASYEWERYYKNSADYDYGLFADKGSEDALVFVDGVVWGMDAPGMDNPGMLIKKDDGTLWHFALRSGDGLNMLPETGSSVKAYGISSGQMRLSNDAPSLELIRYTYGGGLYNADISGGVYRDGEPTGAACLYETYEVDAYEGNTLKAEESAKPPAQSEDAQALTVYVNRSGSKYHRSDCSYLGENRISTRLSEAADAGYTPCSRCNP